MLCWVCGGVTSTGMHWRKWSGSNFVGQNRVRAPQSEWVCPACVYFASRTSPVPGRPPKPGNKHGGNYRNYSHMFDANSYVNASKGEKPAILAWLQRPHKGPWFAAIAESGQKHVLLWAPVNPGRGRGRIRFEEQTIELPDKHGWSVVPQLCDLLTAGATKASVKTGDYTPREWELCGHRLTTFEARWSYLRGGGWFDLALWLAQRDEEKTATRQVAEKEKKRGRKAKRSNPRADGGSAARSEGAVSGRRREPSQALGSAQHEAPQRGETCERGGGLAHDDVPEPPARKPVEEQLSLFDRAGA